MKSIFLLIVSVIIVCTTVHAQNKEPLRMTEQQLPVKNRDAYINQAKRYMRNYYEQLLLNVQDGMMQEAFIRHHLDTAQTRYMPEFLLQPADNNQFLRPDQYLLELDKQYAGFNVDNLQFTIDNISISSDDFFLSSLVSCYLMAEYDLTLAEEGRTLFKRRCRAYCLFPNISAYIDIKLLQVETVQNIIAYQSSAKIGGWAEYGFDSMGKFNEDTGIAIVRKGKKYGFVHKDGAVISEPIYENILCNELKFGGREQWESNVLYMSVRKDGKWGMIDRKGRMVIPTVYQQIQSTFIFTDDMIGVCLNDRYGCVDSLGNVTLPLIYEAEIYLRLNLPARTKMNGKWGFVNKQGEAVVPFVYDNASYFHRDFYIDDNDELILFPALAWVRKKKKYGFVDVKGRLVVPLEYDDAEPYHYGKAAVMKDSKWGYVDTNGKIIIPLIYDGANLFIVNRATVKKGEWWAMIDETGNNVTPFIYNTFHTFRINGFTAVKAGKDVYLDGNGNEYATELDRQEHSDSIMASQGSVISQWSMGQKHLRDKNYSRALYWFKMAANDGHISSMVETGKIYYYGFGIEKDYSTSLRYFEKAGQKDMEACYYLGWMAEHGQGRDKSISEAIIWYANCPKYRDADERLKKLKGQY